MRSFAGSYNYVLRWDDTDVGSKYYVGSSNNVFQRLSQHETTRPGFSVDTIFRRKSMEEALIHEELLTDHLKREHGVGRVTGGE